MNITDRGLWTLNLGKMTIAATHAVIVFSREWWLQCVLIMAVILSAFGVIYARDLHRCLLSDTQHLQSTYHQLLEQKDQLLIERGALSNQARIQRLAQQKLSMCAVHPADVVLLHAAQ